MNACKLGLEGIVSKKLNAPYKSGPSKGVAENQKSEGTRQLHGQSRERFESNADDLVPYHQ
jgi:hypothetical protein